MKKEHSQPQDKTVHPKNNSTIGKSQRKKIENLSSVDIIAETDDSENKKNENSIDRNLIAFFEPLSFESEKFRILRTEILFPFSGEISRTIAVTSAVQGEGKSFVTANLAISIADGIDKHVLLIDCDLRKSKIHRLFGFKEDVPGLSEYLSGKMELTSLLLKSRIPRLTILPAGSLTKYPSELLSSDRMKKMLIELTERYTDRIILLDTTPLSMTAEANALIKLVDGIILVVRQGYTPMWALKDLIKKIDKEKIIGTVFNCVDMRSLAQYEYRKYQKSYY